MRELIIGSDSFTQEHLPLIAASPLLNNLVIIRVPFDDLDALNDSPRIKSLSLVGVTTLAPEAIARLTQITTLRISNLGTVDLAPLAGLTKLVSITLDGSSKHDLQQISHLPIGSVHVNFAPSKEAAQALIAEAKQVWPSMRSTGYRVEWER